MVNPFRDTNWNPDRAARRAFARSLIVGFPALALLGAFSSRLLHGAWQPGYLRLGAIGFAVGAVLWMVPRIALPFYRVWYFVACSIGLVVSNLLLSLFFFGVLTPVGLALRALGRDPLSRKLERSRPSYWEPAEGPAEPERYFRQY